MMNVEVVLNNYIEAALWSSVDDQDQPLDMNYYPEDLAPETLEKFRADVEKFVRENEEDLMMWGEGAEEQAGYDFWMTRNHHGVGFWEPEWTYLPGNPGDRLDEASKKFNEVYIYVGDDGKIYC